MTLILDSDQIHNGGHRLHELNPSDTAPHTLGSIHLFLHGPVPVKGRRHIHRLSLLFRTIVQPRFPIVISILLVLSSILWFSY